MKPARIYASVMVAALAVAGAWLSIWAAEEAARSGKVPDFYQREFAPAVMLVCGRGYQNMNPAGPELTRFLLHQVDSFRCESLPRTSRSPELSAFQRISVYLEYTVAGVWRVLGISWNTLRLLEGAFGAVVAVTLYGIMRLGLNVTAAGIATLATITSPVHLAYVPELRDYSKAPFLLALILIMGIMVSKPASTKGLFGLAGAGGLVAGVGFGFRTDLLVIVWPFAITVVFFRAVAGASPIRRAMTAAGGVLVFAGSFLLTAWPVIHGYAEGGNTAHVALLGFASSFDRSMGVESRHYEHVTLYNDSYIVAVVNDYERKTTAAESVARERPQLSVGSKEYDRMSSRYLRDLLMTFPADVVIRGISASTKIIDLPFNDEYAARYQWVQNPTVRGLYARRRTILSSVPWAGLTAVLLLSVGLMIANLRLGLFAVFLIAFLGASTAVQFHERHFFYLEFVGWWAVVFIAVELPSVAWALFRRRMRPEWSIQASLWRALLVMTGLCMTGAIVIVVARFYQQRRLDRLFRGYLDAPSESVGIESRPTRDGKSLLKPVLDDRELGTPAIDGADGAYLKIEITPASCDFAVLDATVRYVASVPALDFSHRLRVPLPPTAGGAVTVLLPVYVLPESGLGWSRFEGLEIDSRSGPCIGAIRRIEDRWPKEMRITAILSEDWRTAQHYQTLASIERRYDGALWSVHVFSPEQSSSSGRLLFHRPVEGLAARAAYHPSLVHIVGPSAIEMDGNVATAYEYLLTAAPRPAAESAHAHAIIEGELLAGGLTFGLLRGEAWYQSVNITDPGRFVAFVEAKDEGQYSWVLANDNDRSSRRTAFRIDRIGWIADEAEKQ